MCTETTHAYFIMVIKNRDYLAFCGGTCKTNIPSATGLTAESRVLEAANSTLRAKWHKAEFSSTMPWSVMKHTGIYADDLHKTRGKRWTRKQVNVKIGYKAVGMSGLCRHESRSDKEAVFRVWWEWNVKKTFHNTFTHTHTTRKTSGMT